MTVNRRLSDLTGQGVYGEDWVGKGNKSVFRGPLSVLYIQRYEVKYPTVGIVLTYNHMRSIILIRNISVITNIKT
jgi:hypothetical protein